MGLCPRHVDVEFLNVGGWLTHGDFALEVGVDFLAVAEHRLIPARVRSEWSRLKRKGLASAWAPDWQESFHVGNAGVGDISLKGAPLALLLLPLLSLKGSLTMVEWLGVCFLLVMVGSCTWSFFSVTRARILILSSLL